MQTIYLDISNKGVIPTIYAKQGDVGRKFEVVLTDAGLPYVPAGGSAFSVWYSGASGDGNYTDIGDKSAFSVNGNKVVVEMISQMLLNNGDGVLALVLNDPNGNQISTWNIPYICECVPGSDSEEAKDYYSAFSDAVKNLPYPDSSLSVLGKAADAAAVGEALAGKAPAIESPDYPGCYYRIVNGMLEWINPPMVPGKEYRTTDRLGGRAVYAKRLTFTAVAANQNYFDPGVYPAIEHYIGCLGRVYFTETGYSFQVPSANAYVIISPDGYSILTDFDMRNHTVDITLRYTE